MTRAECEAALVNLAKAAKAVLKAYAPDTDHIRLCCVDEMVSVIGYSGDAVVVNATEFPDDLGDEVSA